MIDRNLIAAIIVAIGCMLVFVLVLPQYNAISVYSVALAARENLIAERRAQVDNVKKLLELYKTNQNQIANLSLLLPEKKQLDQIIIALQAAAQNSGMQTSEMTLGAEQNQAAGPKKINIRLNVSGSYQTFLLFLRQIENSLRVFDVSEINIGKAPTGAGFSLEIKMNTYSVK